MTDDELTLLMVERNLQVTIELCEILDGKKKIELPEIGFKRGCQWRENATQTTNSKGD